METTSLLLSFHPVFWIELLWRWDYFRINENIPKLNSDRCLVLSYQ